MTTTLTRELIEERIEYNTDILRNEWNSSSFSWFKVMDYIYYADRNPGETPSDIEKAKLLYNVIPSLLVYTLPFTKNTGADSIDAQKRECEVKITAINSASQVELKPTNNLYVGSKKLPDYLKASYSLTSTDLISTKNVNTYLAVIDTAAPNTAGIVDIFYMPPAKISKLLLEKAGDLNAINNGKVKHIKITLREIINSGFVIQDPAVNLVGYTKWIENMLHEKQTINA